VQTYTYVARDSQSGQNIKAEIEAQNEQAAAKLLMERGMAPLEIEEKVAKSTLGGFSTRIPTKQKVIFSRQLSTLISAGLPIIQSLRNVRNQTRNKNLQSVIDKIITDVEAGSSLADSLTKYPRAFDNVFVSLVAAGEASGTLDNSLERLANQQEKDAEIKAKVRGAMLYPVIVLLVLFGVVGFMLTTILPQVESLYQNLPGAQLPFVTKLLLVVSHGLIRFWWLLFILVAIGAVFTLRWSRTEPGQKFFDNVKLHAWPVAPLFRKLYMARFARTGATLVGSGVPMIKMLNTTGDAVGNVHVSESIKKATEKVKGGKALSESIRGDENFLDLVPDMIQIGEQSGQLEGMLGKVADYYEKEVDNQIKTVSTIIEPALMIVVGIMALIVVAAVLLPIYSLAGKNLFQSNKGLH
jgi:type IV pilus assembly protein PilC